MTYPEQVAHDWFVKHDFMFSHNKKVGKYFPDFLIESIIVEIDGEHSQSCTGQPILSPAQRDARQFIYC
jgi:very-short-patch-repair endonuclease